MEPSFKKAGEQSSRLSEKFTENSSISKPDENTNSLMENNLASIAPIDDQSAYETIIQKLKESKEEWFLVSPSEEDRGYAYRHRLAPTK